MSTSQNGWSVVASGTSGDLATLPHITGKVRSGAVLTVFTYLADQFNANVEPIVKSSSWGYANRTIRGAKSISNHASGTATDFNAPDHPLGEVGTFTAAQVAAIRAILAVINRDADVVRWGGDYSGRKDEMHFEIVGTAAEVAAAAARLSGSPTPSKASPRSASVSIATQKAVRATPDGYWGDDTDWRVNIVRAAINGQRDATAQQVIGTTPDGIWGPKSAAALTATIKALQKAWDTGADGVWGPKTEAAYATARANNYKTW